MAIILFFNVGRTYSGYGGDATELEAADVVRKGLTRIALRAKFSDLEMRGRNLNGMFSSDAAKLGSRFLTVRTRGRGFLICLGVGLGSWRVERTGESQVTPRRARALDFEYAVSLHTHRNGEVLYKR